MTQSSRHLPPHTRPKKQPVLHLLDTLYEQKRIEKLRIESKKIEKLSRNVWVDEGPKENEITLTMSQWNRTHFGRIYRKERVTVVPYGSGYRPRFAIIEYGHFPDKKAEEHVRKHLNDFIKETNKSIGYGVVEMIKSSVMKTIGFKINGGWKGIQCYIRQLDENIYGPNIPIDLYGI